MCIHNCCEEALGADEAYRLNAVFHQTHLLFILGILFTHCICLSLIYSSIWCVPMCMSIYVHRYRCTYVSGVCVCMNKPKVDSKQLLQSKTLAELRTLWFQLVWPPHPSNPSSFCVFTRVLNSGPLHLHGKCFIHWTISLAPSSMFNALKWMLFLLIFKGYSCKM